MRAVVVERYGPPSTARIMEVPDPVPRANEAVVRVVSTAVTAGDARIRGGTFPAGMGMLGRLALGVRGPRARVLGMVVSGVVEAVGPAVTELEVGAEVAGFAGSRMGTHAELVAIAADRLARKPAGVSHDAAAAAIFGGTTAMHFLLDVARMRAGHDVLIVGASGSVGTAAVQLAKRSGATVTAVASTRNVELLHRLGIDAHVDYTTTPVTSLGRRFDVVLDTVGTLAPREARALLREGGTAALVAADLVQMLAARGPVKAGTAPSDAALVARVLALLERSELDPVIQEALPLEEIARAYEIADSRRKVGNVIVRP